MWESLAKMPYPKDDRTLKSELLERVKAQLLLAYRKSRYYRELLEKNRILPERIKSLKDFASIPVTLKPTLRERNRDFIGAPPSRWIDVASTSGTTGNAVYLPATRADLKRVSSLGAKTLALAGINRQDLVQLTLPMGTFMWTAGFGFYLCYSYLGCGVLRMGPGNTEKQLEVMENLKVSVLHGVPSFMVKLGEAKLKAKKNLKVKKVVTIGENVLNFELKKNALGGKIEELWGAELFSTYGATEGPFLGGECRLHQGHHLHPKEVYVEILDPQTFQPLPAGEKGVVVITPLGVSGFPLLRYGLGDLSYLIPGVCPCGAVSQRLGPIFARTDHMMKIKGVVIYPERVRELLLSRAELSSFQIEAYTENFMDQLRVYFAPRQKTQQPECRSELTRFLKANLGITVELIPLAEAELTCRILPPESNKPRYFVDKRVKP